MNDLGTSSPISAETVPATARDFESWLDEQRSSMPPAIQVMAERALLTLQSLDQVNATKSEAFMAASRADLRAFAEAWAAHNANH